MKTVSVLIPCYNAAPFVGRAIESALAAPEKPQVVVVDDGSVDQSAEVLRGFGDRITLKQQVNGGVASARNAAIPLLRGHYTLLLDADDSIAPNGLTHLLGAMDDRDDRISYGMFEIWDQDMRTRLSSHLPPLLREASKQFLQGNVAPPGAFLFPTKIFNEIGGFEQSIAGCEDWDFWLRVAEVGYVFKRTIRPVFRYRRYHGTLSTNPIKMTTSGMSVISRAFDRMYGPLDPERPEYCGKLEDLRARQFVYAGTQFGLAAVQNEAPTMKGVLSLLPTLLNPPIARFIAEMKGAIYWNASSNGKDAIPQSRAAIVRGVEYLIRERPNIFQAEATTRAAKRPDWSSLVRRPGPAKAIRLLREAVWSRSLQKRLLVENR